ncbi:hypothetical protein GUITHDRAFT_104776 [Guillardia theta CCMP2712]|uniref:Uncharacterized protein n=1 Tax=Guillardia theta (strain CCMP2712) TaxID=905079 RepID=L1JLL5_GUITC|nr:hypothetical protein GUITHDRAFT_104776 [Guillardia theta CCMP2712]EKX49247.1 hypothetical protein GUITHDRAFT_104776 [Guillardia theta CCMP2712]|eukprot:XP_005836227.1 hypothetical protein GUITHDRAFT_104776 [Guillardia theta CCMP2712]
MVFVRNSCFSALLLVKQLFECKGVSKCKSCSEIWSLKGGGDGSDLLGNSDARSEVMGVKNLVLSARKLVKDEKDYVAAFKLLSKGEEDCLVDVVVDVVAFAVAVVVVDVVVDVVVVDVVVVDVDVDDDDDDDDDDVVVVDAIQINEKSFPARYERLSLLWDLNFDNEQCQQMIKTSFKIGDEDFEYPRILSKFFSEAEEVVSLDTTSAMAKSLLIKINCERTEIGEVSFMELEKQMKSICSSDEAKALHGVVLCTSACRDWELLDPYPSASICPSFGYLKMWKHPFMWKEGIDKIESVEPYLSRSSRGKILLAWKCFHEEDLQSAQAILDEMYDAADWSLSDEVSIARLRGQSEILKEQMRYREAAKCLRPVVLAIKKSPNLVKTLMSKPALHELAMAVLDYRSILLFHIAQQHYWDQDSFGDLNLARSALETILKVHDEAGKSQMPEQKSFLH